MDTAPIMVEAILQSDGVTLSLAQSWRCLPAPSRSPSKPPSRATGPTMLETLDRIHNEQRQRGHMAMTEDEMLAEIAALRAEDSQEQAAWREIESHTTSSSPGGS